MLDIVLSNRFKKDLKLAARRGYDFDLLDEIVSKLANGKTLPEKNKDHPYKMGRTVQKFDRS